jgi:putative ABC transport system permease protein
VSLLIRSQLRFFLFAPWSTLTVLLGVTLAISSIVAVHQISQRVVVSLAAVTPPQLAGVTHQIRRPEMRMDDYFQLRSRWRAGELPGVVALMPIVTGSAGTWRVIGLDPFSGVEAAFGLALLAPGQVVASTAAGRPEGSRIDLDGASLEVVRLLEAVPENLLLTDIGTAQVALGRSDDALDGIGLVVSNPAQMLIDWTERLMPGFSAGIGVKTFRLAGWEVIPAAAGDPALAFSRSVLFNLGALGSLALVVAWLLVYQVSVIWLRRRAATLERLRQMGVTEGEIRRVFLTSLTGLGLLAGGLGLLIGEGLAAGLAGVATGFSDALPATELDRWVTGKALGSALLVCLVGGWIACERESEGPGRTAARYGFYLLCAGVVAAGVYGLLDSDTLLGGFAAIAAAGLMALICLSPLLSALKSLSRHLRGGLLSRMGLRELLWYPGDLAVAIGALVLALATSVALALMVDSFRSDFEAMLEQRVVNDLFVTADDGRDLSALALRLEAMPGVSRVQRYGRVERQLAGRRVQLSYSGFDARESRRYGLAEPLAPGAVLVSERLARDLGLTVGSNLRVDGLSFTIARVFPGYGDTVPRLIISSRDAAELGIAPHYDRLSIDAVDPGRVRDALDGLATDLQVEQRSAIRTRALNIFDQTFAITRALTLMALIVASVGLYNALLALELLQQPSRRLLHTMGLTALEQRLIAGWRVLGVGIVSLLLALPLGMVMGWLLCSVINPRAFGWSLDLQLTAGAFVWPVTSALVVMMAAGLAPIPQEPVEEAGERLG